MKKSLIALAVLATTGAAFAQSTVTLGGTLEVAPIRVTNVKTQAFGALAPVVTVKGTTTAQHNTWSTSVLNFIAVEDLGGGLRATATMVSGVGDGFAARERTLALSSGMGTLRVGRFVPAAAAGFHALSGSGSATHVGSMYALSTPNSGGAGPTNNAIHTNATNFERQDNVLQYTSPNFSGFTANAAIAVNKSDSDAVLLRGSADTQQTSLHVGYAQGPLAFGLGMNRAKGSFELPVGSLAVSSTNSTLNWVGASYNLGVARLFATYVTRKGESTAAGVGATGTDIKATGLGVSAPLGATTLRASLYSGKDARTAAANDNVKLTGYQLSAQYALSKRTSVIAATGSNESKRDGGIAETRKTTASTLALNHTF